MSKVELEELVVKLAVEHQQLMTGMKEASKSTDAAMREMQNAVKDLADSSGKDLNRWGKMWDNALSFAGGQMIADGIQSTMGFLKDMFSSMINEGLEGAKAGEDAMNRYNQALSATGQYSQENSALMDEFASAMQRTTKFGDDQIVSSAALIQSLGQLKADALPGATQAAMDLATGLGIDLESATRLVGKAAAGEIGTFKKYGIAIEEGSSKSETFANVLDAITARFGGSAAAAAKTFSGQQAIMIGQYGELAEAAMTTVTTNLSVINVMGYISKSMAGATDEINGNKDSMRALVSQGLSSVIDGASYVVVALDAIVRATEFAYQGIATVFNGVPYVIMTPFAYAIEQVEELLSAFGLSMPDTVAAITEPWKAMADTFGSSAKEGVDAAGKALSGDSFLGTVATKLQEMKLASEAGFEAMKAGAEAVAEPLNNHKQVVEEITEAQKKQAEEGKALSEEAVRYLEEHGEMAAEIRQGLHAAEYEALAAALDQKLIKEQEYLLAVDGLKTKFADEDKKREEKKTKAEDALLKYKLDAASTFFGGMSALAREGGRETFEIGKRLAQAQAIISGIQAVQGALANPPFFPYNAAIVAGVAAQTVSNIARIEGTAFATGGTVPGIGFGDTVPAMLTPGEEVVNLSTANKLRDFLDNGGGGGGTGGSFTVVVENRWGDLGQLTEMIESKIVERVRTGQSVLFG